MSEKSLDIAALGSCYVDTNCEDYPFKADGIPSEIELVGGYYDVTLGGSAVNFCALLQSLGLRTTFVGIAGTDSNGDLLVNLLEKRGIQPAIIREPDVLTNISFNMTNPEGKHIMLVAGTANASLTPEYVLPKLEEILPKVKHLYLGGYFKLKLLTPVFAEIADYAKQHGTSLILDHGRIPAGANEAVIATLKKLVLKASYYFPSRNEFCELWGVRDIEDGLRLLNKQAPELVVVVKDSDNGAFFFANGDVRHAAPVKVEKVRNVTGAGDSFNAGVIRAITRGETLESAVTYGCRVAAAKIGGKTAPLL